MRSSSSKPLLTTLSGVRGERVPVWMMRQAGRYLPEYRELRAQHPILELMRQPELAAEVTMQPLRRFPVDAAIIFADILTPLIGMGLNLEFKQGEGPVFSNPIRSADDVKRLVTPQPEENVGYTLEALRIVARALEGKETALIGFSGAPFTLSSYTIEGGSPGDMYNVKALMYSDPATWHRLQEKLVTVVADYLVAQGDAGAEVLQLFDSWLGWLSPSDFEEFVAPHLREVVKRVRAASSAPLLFFSTGTAGLMPLLGQIPFHAYGLDWRVDMRDAVGLLGRRTPLQGNLDPLLLLGPVGRMKAKTDEILEAGKDVPHIMNLGHGILQQTPIETVERFIEHVRSWKP